MRRFITRSLLTLVLTLYVNGCTVRLPPPDWRLCHEAMMMEISPRGACVIYNAILTTARKHWEDGMTPNGVRLNGATLAKLAEESQGVSIRKGKTTYGLKVVSLETPFGTLRVLEDKSMPDDAVIVTVAIPTYTSPFMRGYYDENGELSAE